MAEPTPVQSPSGGYMPPAWISRGCCHRCLQWASMPSYRGTCPFPASGGCLLSLAQCPCLHLQSQQRSIFSAPGLLCPSDMDSSDDIGPIQIIQDTLLSQAPEFLLPGAVTQLQVLGMRTHCKGGFSLSTTLSYFSAPLSLS